MKVPLQKTFELPVPASAAWAFLQDIEAVAGCMPGAAITQRVDDSHYKGTVSVKLGPANLAFRGDIDVSSLDPATRSLRMVGKGTDTTGSSGASMDLSARVEEVDASSCRLLGTSEISMSGKAATFGARMMGPLSEQLLQQFGANFETRLKARYAAQAAADAPQAPTASPAPSSPAQPDPPAQLDGLALAWALLKNWLRSLFGARKA